MLNISPNKINPNFDSKKYSTFNYVEGKKSSKVLKKLLYASAVACIIIAFLPWTQNIQSNGLVTTLKPNQRPQTIHTIIGGRIEKWYVQEGDIIKKGDTIVQLSEVKSEYFDPQLLERTKSQMELKQQTADSYEDKIGVLNYQTEQLSSLKNISTLQAKQSLQQTVLKIERDSLAYAIAKINSETSVNQYDRTNDLFKEGLKSKTDLETKLLKVEQNRAYELEAKNKWLTGKSELINARIQLSNIESKFNADIAKVNSDKFTAMSSMYDSRSMVNKLQNQYANYEIRNGLYFITAPQDGYIAKMMKNGIGETLKEGAQIMSIMPSDYELAIEMYVAPIDLPLIKNGQHVRVQFDGWPAIVFSGWPNNSFGTFGGTVYAVDRFISENGKYRVLIKPDETYNKWPKQIRFGGGASNMLLLEDVSIWYEIWRKINGFPPNFYKSTGTPTKTI